MSNFHLKGQCHENFMSSIEGLGLNKGLLSGFIFLRPFESEKKNCKVFPLEVKTGKDILLHGTPGAHAGGVPCFCLNVPISWSIWTVYTCTNKT